MKYITWRWKAVTRTSNPSKGTCHAHIVPRVMRMFHMPGVCVVRAECMMRHQDSKGFSCTQDVRRAVQMQLATDTRIWWWWGWWWVAKVMYNSICHEVNTEFDVCVNTDIDIDVPVDMHVYVWPFWSSLIEYKQFHARIIHCGLHPTHINIPSYRINTNITWHDIRTRLIVWYEWLAMASRIGLVPRADMLDMIWCDLYCIGTYGIWPLWHWPAAASRYTQVT